MGDRSGTRRLTLLVSLFAAIALFAAGAPTGGAEERVIYYDDIPSARSASSPFTFLGSPWPTTSLTYGFGNTTPDLAEASVTGAISTALNTWGSVSPLSFSELPDCGAPVGGCDSPDIRVLFAFGAHGDDDPFDGEFGVLAHAFSPFSGIGGDTHFDEAETWRLGADIDLTTVAIHEFGHALGLGHTGNENCPDPGGRFAIMCAIYEGPNTTLHPDDIAGIQALYGSGGGGGGPTVSASVQGKGTIFSSPAGIACPPTCSASFTEGSSVTFSAQKAGRRWRFRGWTGACEPSGKLSSCTLTVGGPLSIGAKFKKKKRR